MKERVYLIRVSEADSLENIKAKFRLLLEKTNLLDFVKEKDRVCIKMHFGEEANKGFVRPEYLRILCDYIRKRNATPFLADTNTLYKGRRTTLKEHLKLAYEHGFKPDSVNAEVVIVDDTKKKNTSAVNVNGKFIKIAKIARIFLEADAIISVAHFKGHLMTGFGGALKNIGMGCATRKGKLAQHSDVSPIVYIDRCVGCGSCEKVCPAKAISIKDKKSHIDSSICIGCASCIAACPYYAIDVDWESGGSNIQEKMVEHAKAVLKNRAKALFISFAIKITKDCDCLAKDDPRIAPDIGIFVSRDPVSIDKACLDLINKACGKDIFKEAHPKRDGRKQLQYASKIGLGNLDYQLIELS